MNLPIVCASHPSIANGISNYTAEHHVEVEPPARNGLDEDARTSTPPQSGTQDGHIDGERDGAANAQQSRVDKGKAREELPSDVV